MSFDGLAAVEGAATDSTNISDQEAGHSKRQYTIKGIEGETVNLMRTAARKQGMRVGAWVSVRLREAADRALQGEEKVQTEMVELRDHIRRIQDNQNEERQCLRAIQEELAGMIRAQHSIMARLLNKE